MIAYPSYITTLASLIFSLALWIGVNLGLTRGVIEERRASSGAMRYLLPKLQALSDLAAIFLGLTHLFQF